MNRAGIHRMVSSFLPPLRAPLATCSVAGPPLGAMGAILGGALLGALMRAGGAGRAGWAWNETKAETKRGGAR